MLAQPGSPTTEGERVIARRFERYEVVSQATWDFFSYGLGPKPGVITNVSRGGCLLHTSELIEHRRWLRILATGRGNVHLSLIGRVIRCENALGMCADRVTLYRYGIEFARPGAEERAYPMAEQPWALFEPAPDKVAYLITEPLRKVRT